MITKPDRFIVMAQGRRMYRVAELQDTIPTDHSACEYLIKYKAVTGPLGYDLAIATWKELVGINPPTKLTVEWVE